jgi:hypothetical protein
VTLVSIETQHAAGADSPARDHETPTSEAELMGRMLTLRFKGYGADVKRSLFQLATTAMPFVALLVVMGAASRGAYWLTLLLAIPTAGLLVRLFIIQHDCGHGSFFKSRAANDFLGRVLGVLTLTPYGCWKQGHAIHHASTGNLDRRGRGDIDILTVAEYEALTPPKKLAYRLYRNPFVMILLGAPIHFILLQRLPTGPEFRNRDARRSILLAERRAGGGVRPADGDVRGRAGADDLSSGDDHLVVDRQLAVLCPAPVRGHLLGARRRVEFPRGRGAWQFLFHAAAGAALVQRQYRPAPPSPFVQPYPQLPAARLFRIRAGAGAPWEADHAAREPAMLAAGLMGRATAPDGAVSRFAAAARLGA